jgi:hypothetical protein
MADQLLVASDENQKQNPNLNLSQLVYSYEYKVANGVAAGVEEIKSRIMSSIVADNMLPYYNQLAAKHSWIVDESLVATLRYKMLLLHILCV